MVNNTPSVGTDSTKIFFNLQYSGDAAERITGMNYYSRKH